MIRRFRALGWSGPFAGKRHAAMIKGTQSIPIPNPHRGDIDWTLTKLVLRQAGIDPQDWDRQA